MNAFPAELISSETGYVLPSSTPASSPPRAQVVASPRPRPVRGDLFTASDPALTFSRPVASQLLMASMELISQMRFRSWSMICLSCWFFCLSFCRGHDKRRRRISAFISALMDRNAANIVLVSVEGRGSDARGGGTEG